MREWLKILQNCEMIFFFKKLIKKKFIKKNNFFSYRPSYLDNEELIKFNKKIKLINFKLAILSLGSRGHFASIFELNKTNEAYYAIEDSPKFPKSRATVSLNKIQKCEKIIFIASKKNKKKEIKDFYKNRLIKFLGYKKVYLYTY